jgi:hypothetical protein
MIKRGLRAYAIKPGPAKYIVHSVALSKLTYGLHKFHLTQTDKAVLLSIIADTARAIFGYDEDRNYPNEWIIRDTGTPNPLDVTIAKDITIYHSAKHRTINPFVGHIILGNKDLKLSCDKALQILGINNYLSIKKDDINKHIITAARKVPINFNIKNHTDEMVTEKTIDTISWPRPYERLKIETHYIKTFLETRAALHMGNKRLQEKCPYCKDRPTHTFLHIINDCTFNLTATERNLQRVTNPLVLENINIDTIVAAVGGSGMDTSSFACAQRNYILKAIATSPILYPPKPKDYTWSPFSYNFELNNMS